jgi:cell shape-determining protein MreC
MAEHEKVPTLLLFLTILVSTIVMLSDLTGYLGQIKRLRAIVAFPVQSFVHSTTTIGKNIFAIFGQQSIVKENAELKQRAISLELTLEETLSQSQLRNNIEKYESLLSPKDYKKTQEALILDTNYGDFQGKLLLNKGSTQGIEKGMLVVLGNNYIGFIAEANDYTSVCHTFELPNQQLVGYLLSRKVTASVQTSLNDIRLYDLLATDTLQLHDTVSVRREKSPYYVTLGNIAQLPEQTGSAERVARIKSSITINELSFVTIVQE